MAESRSKKTSRFLVYHPTPEDVAEAFRRSEKMGIPPSSLTQGAGRMTGFLGEIAFASAFPEWKYVGDQSFTHDYELDNLKVDIKSKVCASPPKVHYVSSVLPKKDGSLPADYYFFTRVRKDFRTVWLCGWVTARGIAKPAYFKEKGEADDHGFTFFADGYHIPIRKTRRPDSFRSQYCRPGRD